VEYVNAKKKDKRCVVSHWVAWYIFGFYFPLSYNNLSVTFKPTLHFLLIRNNQINKICEICQMEEDLEKGEIDQ